MKLNIGEKIRKLRKKADMTQEQLADRLGVSYQSVSRWENGATYPDMEFIPAIARIFNVSTDELFGIPEEKKEQDAKELLTKLTKACHEEPCDKEKIKELIRDFRRDYLKTDAFFLFWLSGNSTKYRDPDILAEIRTLAEEILQGDFDNDRKHTVIDNFSFLEDEDKIKNFLNQYASTYDTSENTLLLNRYRKRGNNEKADICRQNALFNAVGELVGNSGLWLSKDPEKIDVPTLHHKNRIGIDLLHSLCCCIPDEKHPISGNGEVDYWIEERLWMGFHEAGYLAYEGKHDDALTVLEDTVALLEKGMQIKEPTELRCSSPWLSDIVMTAEECWGNKDQSLLLGTHEIRHIYINNDLYCYCIDPTIHLDLITATADNKWYTREYFMLDPIRNDPRYQACVERVKALVEIREKANE